VRVAQSAPVRALHLSLAALFFAVAMLGLFLPVLPTTPFLLLTSWFLARSSPAWNARLHRSPLFGPLLSDWERHRGVRPHVKASALGALAIALGVGLWLGDLGRWPRVALVGLGLVGAIVILRLRTIRPGNGPTHEDPRPR
jgi:uncharacterized membrane protein YbaN (DUF454 family)